MKTKNKFIAIVEIETDCSKDETTITIEHLVTAGLNMLQQKSDANVLIKNIEYMTNRKFTIINDYDGNDVFEVEAAHSQEAMSIALGALGWGLIVDSFDEDSETDEDQ